MGPSNVKHEPCCVWGGAWVDDQPQQRQYWIIVGPNNENVVDQKKQKSNHHEFWTSSPSYVTTISKTLDTFVFVIFPSFGLLKGCLIPHA